MEPILVTGGAGFIGAYVAQALLARGQRVVTFDSAPLPERLGRILAAGHRDLIQVTGSVTDLELLQRTARQHQAVGIVHSAAIADAEYLSTHPLLAFEVNAGGTANVLESARCLGIPRVVHVSSIAAFASKRYEPIDEGHPAFDIHMGHPAGPYGASKVAAEVLGLTYYSTFGVEYVALRPAGVYGYGMKVPGSIRRMVEDSYRGLPVRISGIAKARRSYTYIRDCVAAILAALDADNSRLSQRVYTVADPQQYSLAEVAVRVRSLVPGSQIELTGETTPAEAYRWANYGQLGVSAAGRDLGFQARYSLDDGLREYVETIRSLGLG